MKIVPLHPNFKMPERKSEGAGGFDLFMPRAGTIYPYADGAKFVNLGFCAAVPKGYVALLLPRSGAGAKYGVELNNTCGVIDSDYRGEWIAALRTKNAQSFSWEEGERVLQAVFVPVADIELELADSLDETERGEGGFGSTDEPVEVTIDTR